MKARTHLLVLEGVAVVEDEGRSSEGSGTLSVAGKKEGHEPERSPHCMLGNEVLDAAAAVREKGGVGDGDGSDSLSFVLSHK